VGEEAPRIHDPTHACLCLKFRTVLTDRALRVAIKEDSSSHSTECEITPVRCLHTLSHLHEPKITIRIIFRYLQETAGDM